MYKELKVPVLIETDKGPSTLLLDVRVQRVPNKAQYEVNDLGYGYVARLDNSTSVLMHGTRQVRNPDLSAIRFTFISCPEYRLRNSDRPYGSMSTYMANALFLFSLWTHKQKSYHLEQAEIISKRDYENQRVQNAEFHLRHSIDDYLEIKGVGADSAMGRRYVLEFVDKTFQKS